MENIFSWDYLTTVPDVDEVFGAFSVIYLIAFTVGLVAAIFAFNRPRIFSARRLLRRHEARRWAGIFIWIFALGLFFFLVRWVQINPFSFGTRFWMYLTLLAALVGLVLFLLQIRVTAPQLEAHAREERAAYMRGLGSRRPPRRSRTRKR